MLVGPYGASRPGAEQAYLERAQRLLEEMQARTDGAVAALDAPPPAEATSTRRSPRRHLRNRLWSLGQGGGSALLRSDRPGTAPRRRRRHGEGDGERFYIGRRHVEDGAANPVVVDWRAPIARGVLPGDGGEPPRPAPAPPLRGRRRGRLVDCVDEVFDDPDHPELATGGGVADPLLAELERSRAGELRDIVATIQAEQDEIIRAPLERAVLVQGGPGTGQDRRRPPPGRLPALRAAAAARRAGRRARRRAGPGRGAEPAVPALHRRGAAVAGGARGQPAHDRDARRRDPLPGAGVDTPEVAALKGDARMAGVLRAALADLRRAPPGGDPVALPTRSAPLGCRSRSWRSWSRRRRRPPRRSRRAGGAAPSPGDGRARPLRQPRPPARAPTRRRS